MTEKEEREKLIEAIEAQGFEILEIGVGEENVFSLLSNWNREIVLVINRATGSVKVFAEWVTKKYEK